LTSPGGNANTPAILDGSNLPTIPKYCGLPPNPEKLAAPPVKLGLACWGKELFVPVDTGGFSGSGVFAAGIRKRPNRVGSTKRRDL